MATDSMSIAEYRELVRTQKTSYSGRRSSGGRMLRLPADYKQECPVPVGTGKSAAEPVKDPGKVKVGSAEKARDRVLKTVEALELARVELTHQVLEDGREHVVISVHGGQTLPPNRVANIGREQSKVSQRAFSRYKHACADRMADAAVLLRAALAKAGVTRFNRECRLTHITYARCVTHRISFLDEDAVIYSFKYVLDGLVAAGLLVDDSRRYVRIVDAQQAIAGEDLLVIELTTQ